MMDLSLPKDFFMKIYETSGTYIRSNGDLCALSTDDRSAFLRYTANNVTCLGAVISWNLSQLYNCKSFIDACINTYGENSVILVQRVLKFIDSDIVIAKLALSLFAFCSNGTIYFSHMTMKSLNTLAIFRIQNTYAEITWNYLIYKYGYFESIQRFMKLIQYLLAATNSIFDGQDIEKHVNDIEVLIEQTELVLLLDDMEEIQEDKN
jgi:hypothetical protein